MDPSAATLFERIEALLPQTQCRRCGYAGCEPYARAVARREAPINQCPPGGEHTVVALAALLRVSPVPLDPARGSPRPLSIAHIDEATCIGCTLCIAACPVDAIVGAAKLMHTVLVERCTGCELCVPPCPVDCIALAPADHAWTRADAELARDRFKARARRLERQSAKRDVPAAGAPAPSEDALRERRQAAVSAALSRARARRAARSQRDAQS